MGREMNIEVKGKILDCDLDVLAQYFESEIRKRIKEDRQCLEQLQV